MVKELPRSSFIWPKRFGQQPCPSYSVWHTDSDMTSSYFARSKSVGWEARQNKPPAGKVHVLGRKIIDTIHLQQTNLEIEWEYRYGHCLCSFTTWMARPIEITTIQLEATHSYKDYNSFRDNALPQLCLHSLFPTRHQIFFRFFLNGWQCQCLQKPPFNK